MCSHKDLYLIDIHQIFIKLGQSRRNKLRCSYSSFNFNYTELTIDILSKLNIILFVLIYVIILLCEYL